MAQRLTTYEALYRHLRQTRQYDDAVRRQLTSGELMQVGTTGKVLANAYEQLRNATEYADGNITLQRAIRRFYKRTLLLTHHKPEVIGQELITELIVSGYLQDGTMGTHAAGMIASLVSEHLELFKRMRASKSGQRHAADWTLSVLSARTYNLLVPHASDLAIASYACQYFLDELPRDAFIETDKDAANYTDALYVAVHQALLQSDIDAVRTDLLRIHNVGSEHIREYIHWNEYALELYTSPLTMRIKRAVLRNGAPFRILRSLAAARPVDEIIADREQFLRAYQEQISIEYRRINTRLNSGVLKSISFLFLTKMIIGLGIEVPFDRYMYGHIIVVPLAINLLFPPLYMATMRLGISMPSTRNAQATTRFMDQLLYGPIAPMAALPRSPSKRVGARIGYSIFFLVPFAIMYFVLRALDFNILQMGIFLIFFSTASFLGFRLSLMVRELRITRRPARVLSMLRDLFYLPFILVGQWLASRYAQVNVIGEIFDLMIELPLKTVLSLIRQWIRFLSDTHEELY